MREIAIGLVAAALLTSAAQGSSLGLEVYREDFSGETGYPTTPEVDLFGLGGFTTPYNAGNGPPALPFPDGTGVVNLAAEGAEGSEDEKEELAGIWTDFASLEPLASYSNVDVSGTFLNYGPAFSGIGVLQVNFGVGFYNETSMTRTEVLAILFDHDFGGAPFMRLGIFSQGGGLPGVDLLRTDALPNAVRTDILSGAPFELDLLFPADLATATARLTVGGSELTTDPLTLTRLDSPVEALLNVSVLQHNFLLDPFTDLGSDDAVSVDLTEVRVFVPEPSTALLFGFGLVGLGVVGRRRR